MSGEILRCYRGACDRPAHPCGYNRVTHGLYCLECAMEINWESKRTRAPGGEFFPLLDHRTSMTSGGSLAPGVVLLATV